MKKTILVLATTLLSSAAYADYFGCKLTVEGKGSAYAEAPYQGRSVSVAHDMYVCDAMMMESPKDILMYLTSRVNGQRMATRTANPLEMYGIAMDGKIEKVTCKCGLN